MIRLLFLLTLLFSSPTLAVEVRGVSQDQLRLLRRDVPEAMSNNPEPSALDLAIQYLYRTGDFETVRAARKEDGSVVIIGFPVKRIQNVVFRGHKAITDAEIRRLAGIDEDQPFDSQKIREGIKSITDRYAELGYLTARATLNTEEKIPYRITLTVEVDEGTPCRIREIRFNTNNSELETALKSKTKKYIKDLYEKDAVENVTQEINNYFADNRYLVSSMSAPEVSISDDKSTATIIYSIERPYRFVLFFDGNTFFEQGEILRTISINSQNPTGANPPAELAERIRALYLKKGFANVSVEPTEQVAGTSFTRTIHFRIVEGPRVRIKKIEIGGQISKSQDWYFDFLDDHSQSVHKYGYYNREDLDHALDAMTTELQNQGYLRAKVRSTRVEYNKARDFVTIEVLIDEGPLTTVVGIDFKGNINFSAEQLKDAIGIYPKGPLSLARLEDSVKLLQEFYTSKGYLDMMVMTPNSEIVTYNDDNTQAKLKYEVYEGPQVRVASISVEGNIKTYDDVILTEIEFKKGDILTPQIIGDSIYRLQRLGLFSEINISTLERGTPIADRTVIIRVSERNPGIFTSGIGVNNEFDLTLRGYLGVGYRNLAGTARALTGRIELKRVTDIDFMDHRLTTGYLEPHLFKSRTRGIVNLTRSYSIKKREKTQVIATDSNELEILLEREFFRHLKVSWTLWSIASLIDFEIDDKIPSDSSVIASIGPTVEFDYRDNPFNPARGFFARVNSEYADPALGSNRKITYTRNNGVLAHYIPLSSNRVVWANSVRGGYIKNLNHETAIPDTKLFTLGGRSTIRGFDTGEIPTRQTKAPVRTESNFYLFKSEIRFPIYGDFGGVVFYDGGEVKILGEEMKGPKYRHSAGFGIRYNTPVGPVSFEFGIKLNPSRELDEDQGRPHFAIGTF